MTTLPLADVHCHLLAGLDDGPSDDERALAMCRIAAEEGTRLIAATAHQNDEYPGVTPAIIRRATERLAGMLRDERIPLTVFPTAEVMVHAELESALAHGELLTVGDHGKHLLIEFPHGLFLDLRSMCRNLGAAGVQPILAHPERNAELLHAPGMVVELIRSGCLMQVSSHSVTNPLCREDERALKQWFRLGLVHLLGSDGHSPRRRPPRMAAAYHKIAEWVGPIAADRICATNGMAVLQGRTLRVAMPELKRSWFSKLRRSGKEQSGRVAMSGAGRARPAASDMEDLRRADGANTDQPTEESPST